MTTPAPSAPLRETQNAPIEFWLVDARRAKRDIDEWHSHDGTIRVFRHAYFNGLASRSLGGGWGFDVRERSSDEAPKTVWAGFESSGDALRAAEIYARFGAEAARKQWQTYNAVGDAIRAELRGGAPAAEQMGLL